MIGAVTGGRDRHPSLAELEAVAAELGPKAITKLRHGDCRGTDKTVDGFVRARALAELEVWPADWSLGAQAGPLRNREMLGGAAGDDVFPPLRERADILLALEGGRGTRDCVRAAEDLGIPVLHIEPVAEPRPWNRHHGRPPGPSVYVGRGSPLGNPFKAQPREGETRAAASARILAHYGRWLRSRLSGSERDPQVITAIESLARETFVVCSCWPNHCHAEVIIRAWRWWQGIDARS